MSRRRAPQVATVAGVLALLLTGCGGDPGAAPATPTTPTSSPAPVTTPSASPAAEAQRVGAAVPEKPTSISLPDGTLVPIEAVGSRRNGLLDVPTDITTAGWWRGGSRIGDPFGSTLVAAHVDSVTQGLGPFSSLLGVQPGDRVLVRTAHLRQEFRVRQLTLRPRGTIEPGASMFSPGGHRRLTLVTCAGPYDKARGGYQNLAVIVAYPISAALRDKPHHESLAEPRHHTRAAAS